MHQWSCNVFNHYNISQNKSFVRGKENFWFLQWLCVQIWKFLTCTYVNGWWVIKQLSRTLMFLLFYWEEGGGHQPKSLEQDIVLLYSIYHSIIVLVFLPVLRIDRLNVGIILHFNENHAGQIQIFDLSTRCVWGALMNSEIFIILYMFIYLKSL